MLSISNYSWMHTNAISRLFLCKSTWNTSVQFMFYTKNCPEFHFSFYHFLYMLMSEAALVMLYYIDRINCYLCLFPYLIFQCNWLIYLLTIVTKHFVIHAFTFSTQEKSRLFFFFFVFLLYKGIHSLDLLIN